MPFDFPEHIDFDVAFEPTKMRDKKYVINAKTGEYLGIVGNGFTCVSHKDFYTNVVDTVTEELATYEIADADYKFSTARNGAWTMLDITLPNMKAKVHTDKHETELANRIISLHGVDGSCSNQAFFGEIGFLRFGN